ncbi:MAG: sodium:proton antiporter [Candidatus Makaraimicrobium thalassicum]|nr:MAG: sodium:proton antiporter [Candidatus Omnitrophota bacterium]
MNNEYRASVVVRTVAYILAAPLIVFGLYVILHGHLTPGGGFAGGAIMATFIALFLVSFGRKGAGSLHRNLFSVLESLGLTVFVVLAFLGISNTFFYNFMVNSGHLFGRVISFGVNPGYLDTGGVIPLMNIAVGLEVFSAISLIVLEMFTYSREDKND